MVTVAVEDPGLNLPAIEFAAMQQAVERVPIVIARRPDLAQTPFKVRGSKRFGPAELS